LRGSADSACSHATRTRSKSQLLTGRLLLPPCCSTAVPTADSTPRRPPPPTVSASRWPRFGCGQRASCRQLAVTRCAAIKTAGLRLCERAHPVGQNVQQCPALGLAGDSHPVERITAPVSGGGCGSAAAVACFARTNPACCALPVRAEGAVLVAAWETTGMEDDQASADARSALASVLPLWKGSSATPAQAVR
jgi:hypothetical protein